ncbi:MAG: biotin/lipoyl-binding protein [Ruminococcus sp.]|uniref:biotin/lipoyl-binding protein n=1 Tax=Ruminococcus sp. TaxID=41978 RepID=UPI0025EE9F0F|nr:biotin/lipoyl-binding protein [Ruminococcus sp.]MBR5682561.1 biotin/lipoyl-binding protein [Ruminococcus sp.]
MNETKEVKDILAEKDEKEKMSPARRRELIKTLIIIFLAIMLVLTFFSNTIMNRSLAEISTESVGSGKLIERIRQTGYVESNQSYEVMIDGNRTIEKIHVKSGQEVKKGDVLFTVNTVSNEALDAAEEALETAKLSYEKNLLKVEPADYTKDNQKIRNLRNELNDLINKRDAAKANEGNVAAAKEAYRNNSAELKKLENEAAKLSSTIRCIDMDDYMEADVELAGDLTSLCAAWNSAETAYQAAREAFEKAESDNAERAKAEMEAKEAERNTAKDTYDQSKKSVRDGLASRMSEANNRIDELKAAIDEYNSENGSEKSESYDTLAESVKAKQNELEEAIIDLDKTKKTDSKTSQSEALDLQAEKKALDKLQEKYDKLKTESESTEIKSKYDGVVSSINVKLDDKATEGVAAAVIDIISEGFTVTLDGLDAEKVKKVKVGSEADITNSYGSDITAVLKEIKNSSAGARKKMLIYTISGEVNSGDRLDLSVPCGSGTYDAIIPRSALCGPATEPYVLMVSSKNTPLGNRYYAEKVSVNVEAEDEISYAVSGGLNRGDYVITAASKLVEPGDQVRMKDK